MRTCVIVLLLTAAVLAAPLSAPASGSAPQARSATCTRAKIGPRIECLAVGRRCRPRYETDYRAYGFTCKRAHDGHHRLRQHSFMGPPVPAPKQTG